MHLFVLLGTNVQDGGTVAILSKSDIVIEDLCDVTDSGGDCRGEEFASVAFAAAQDTTEDNILGCSEPMGGVTGECASSVALECGFRTSRG